MSSVDTKPPYYEYARRQMWDEQQHTGMGVCAMCPKCGGSSSTWCQCAYDRFNPSTQDVQAYKDRHTQKKLAEMDVQIANLQRDRAKLAQTMKKP